jgi:tetratricopeptide (TPR) repeat protein
MPEKELKDIARPLREQYEKAIAAIQRNNLDYAIAILGQVLQKEPAFYTGREALRAAQFKKTGGGRGFLKRMFGTASSSPLLARGQIELRTNPIEALHTAEHILNSDAHSVAAHRLLAEAALASDLPQTAVLSLEIVFRNAPDREVALKLGEALARAGHSERGEKILGELASTFPGDPDILRVLKNVSANRTMSEGGYDALEGGEGSYRDILKDKAEAVSLEQEKREVKTDDVASRLLAEYEVRLGKEPRNLRLLRSAAELHIQKKQFDQALAYYQRIVDAEGVAEPSLEQAITETTLRKFDHELEQLNPDEADFGERSTRLQAERQAYEMDRARALVDKYPNDLQLHFDLGLLYFKAGKFTEAIQALQKAQTNPHRRIAALNLLGQCFRRRGLNDLAARMFQNAIREKPVFDDEKKELLYELGSVLEKMGKAEEAIEQLKLIYEVDVGYRDVAAKVDAYYSGKS